jgi:hypothetical protein
VNNCVSLSFSVSYLSLSLSLTHACVRVHLSSAWIGSLLFIGLGLAIWLNCLVCGCGQIRLNKEW